MKIQKVNTLEEAKQLWSVIKLGKAKDLSNQHFGLLTSLYRTNNQSNNTRWVCLCECGNYINTAASRLIMGTTKSCGCQQHNRNDLINQRFGKLLVIRQMPERDNNYRVLWECQCDCGNKCYVPTNYLIHHKTKSCGCLQKKYFTRTSNLIGKQFGYLTVIKEEPKSYYTCKCICEKIISVYITDLTSSSVISCGCKKGESISNKKIIDLKGQRFGKLIVKNRVPRNKDTKFAYWYCDCDCGKTDIIVRSDHLRKEETLSCGCLSISKGTLKIINILENNNINFEREKTFESCRFPDTNYLAKFDFYLPNYNILIEYDGQQHFSYTQNGWNTKNNFLQTKKRDQFKNEWCLKNNIPLIRIPYTYYDQIELEDLLSNSKFLQKGY